MASSPLSSAFRACALSWASVKHSTGGTDVRYDDKLVAYATIAEQELGKVDEDAEGARTWARNTVVKAVKIAASPSRDADGTKRVLQYASLAGDHISVADAYFYKNEKLCAYASASIWRAAEDDATFIGSGKAANELVTRPLWPHEVDDWVEWGELKATLLGRDQSWEAWIDWYQNRLVGGGGEIDAPIAGRLPLELLWSSAPEALNAKIKEIITSTPPDIEVSYRPSEDVGKKGNTETHVFISYVRENSDVVDRIVRILREHAVKVWLDRDAIEPGARWRDAIKRAIEDGKFFLACFSREYNERELSEMNEELTIAIDQLRRRKSDRSWFIPLIINATEIPSRRISSVEHLSDLQAIKLYEDWDDGIHRILRLLGRDDPAAALVWHLIELAKSPFPGERLRATRELGALSTAAKLAVPVLINAIEHASPDLSMASLEALVSIGAATNPAIEAIGAALLNTNVQARQYAALELGRMGPRAAACVSKLVRALKDFDSGVRFRAANALGKIGSAAVPAVPTLLEALEDSDNVVRWEADVALRRIWVSRT